MMSSEQVFTQCQRCNASIHVKEKMVTLVISTDFVESMECVQPLSANEVATWCETCAPIAIKTITQKAIKENDD